MKIQLKHHYQNKIPYISSMIHLIHTGFGHLESPQQPLSIVIIPGYRKEPDPPPQTMEHLKNPPWQHPFPFFSAVTSAAKWVFVCTY
jgi:hypothetical protein